MPELGKIHVPAGAIQEGMWVARGPYCGEVVAIHEHGTCIGDGTVAWRTFHIREIGLGTWPDQLPYRTVMGPLRATESLAVVNR